MASAERLMNYLEVFQNVSKCYIMSKVFLKT